MNQDFSGAAAPVTVTGILPAFAANASAGYEMSLAPSVDNTNTLDM